MSRLFGGLLPLVLVFVLIGCGLGSRLTQENYDKINTGMNEEQVVEILGKPTEVQTSSMLGFSSRTLIYKSGDRKAEIVLMSDLVASKKGNF